MIKKFNILLLSLLLILTGCQSSSADKPESKAVYYQVFVGSFYDSDNDGIGDLQGIISKLDYLEKDLGVSGIWLSPIHPSPTYHKYDVSDYYDIDRDFGTLEDFKQLANELKSRDMDLMMDFVFNHTSSLHPWFIQAKSAVLNDECDEVEVCDYYNFSDTFDAGYTKLSNGTYYESQFWSEMPDLNLDNKDVRNEIANIASYWIDLGVNAFRLDATTHFYENKISQNTEVLNWFNDQVKSIDENIYVVGEAWTNKSIIFDMYESGIDSFFNFEFSQNDGRITKSINTKKGANLASAVYDYNKDLMAKNPEAIDAVFLSNHDNGRSAGYFANQLDKQKIAASIYLLMPGTSFVYYGEEIGMLGSGVDENKRLPMQWGSSEDKNIPKRYPGADYKDFKIDSVSDQVKNKDSLLAHYQQVIQVKNRYPQLKDGDLSVVNLECSEVYGLRHDDLIVLHNLSDQEVEISIDGKVVEKILSKNDIKDGKLVMDGFSTFIIMDNNEKGR